MRKASSVLSIFLIFSLLNVCSVAAQGYLTNVLSNIKKSHGVEAVESLGAYKSSLLACMMNHQGSESACKDSVSLAPTENFNFEFSLPPKDGSNAWIIKATAKGRLEAEDVVIFSSDENGIVSCKAAGKIAGAC